MIHVNDRYSPWQATFDTLRAHYGLTLAKTTFVSTNGNNYRGKNKHPICNDIAATPNACAGLLTALGITPTPAILSTQPTAIAGPASKDPAASLLEKNAPGVTVLEASRQSGCCGQQMRLGNRT